MKHRARRTSLSAFAAVLLTLVIAGQVLAHSWSAPIPLTSSGGGYGFGVVGLDSTNAVATFVEWNGDGYNVFAQRSPSSGSAWGERQFISADGYDPAISAYGLHVDLAWEEKGRVMYANSTGGTSFGAATPLSPANVSLVINLSVASGPGGLVAVAWQNAQTNMVKVRVSTDSGVTFGPITNFATSIQDMGTKLAAGDGVVYLAYKLTAKRLRVVRSTDAGVSWSTPFVATNSGIGVVNQFSMSASGTHAYLAYAVPNVIHPGATVRYRRTLDSGASWGSERQLSKPSWRADFPQIALQGGVLRAVYERSSNLGIDVYYQQSSNGLTWTAGEVVSTNSHNPFVTFAGKIIVQYEADTGDAYVRTGT